MTPNTEGPWVELDISSISLALLVLGGYVCLIGQLSYWLKERLFISGSLISIALGIAVGPVGLDWLSPWKWTGYDDDARHELTFQLCRLVIGVQVMFAGISLPAAYLKREALSLFILLLPIMTIAWFVSAGFIMLFIPSLSFLESLVISACVTPTDPILANAIVKGRYADKHVPPDVRNIISAESGANDGLGYPFIFLPIFLMRRGSTGSVASALQHWVVQTWLYEIFLACVLGGLIGFLARKTLKEAHKRKLIDHESFLSFGIGLAFLTLGVVGVLGSDDVLACFVAGNSLTWRDFYRIESEDDTFQDVIDNLLNTAIFIYLGALLPWGSFGDASLPLSPWKLVLLVITILIFRRVPWVMLLYPFTPALETRQHALFAGWFGPIGVSAVYYAVLGYNDVPEDREHLRAVILPVVLFIALGSTVSHGITIPLTKLAPLAITHTRSISSYAGAHSSAFFGRIRTSDIRVLSNANSKANSRANTRPSSPVGSASGSANTANTPVAEEQLTEMEAGRADGVPGGVQGQGEEVMAEVRKPEGVATASLRQRNGDFAGQRVQFDTSTGATIG
ncbi:Cation/H+ exchanger [Pseudohyphozyma bogoriensis]|nr:Cation/H+ exchanger [Pseudohyphozyma bogoriensis]